MTISIVQGDTASIVIPVYDADGTAVDLTGIQAATFKVKASIADDTAVITKTLGAGVTKTDTSELTVSLSYTDTAIAAGSYIGEIQITDAAGNISTVRDRALQPFKIKILADLDT